MYSSHSRHRGHDEANVYLHKQMLGAAGRPRANWWNHKLASYSIAQAQALADDGRERDIMCLFLRVQVYDIRRPRGSVWRAVRVARRAGSCDCRGRAAHWQLRDVRARARPAPPPADQFSLESLRPFLSEDFPGAASSRLCRWTGPVAALPSRDERHTLLACCTRWEINSSGVIRLVTLRSAFEF